MNTLKLIDWTNICLSELQELSIEIMSFSTVTPLNKKYSRSVGYRDKKTRSFETCRLRAVVFGSLKTLNGDYYENLSDVWSFSSYFLDDGRFRYETFLFNIFECFHNSILPGPK